MGTSLETGQLVSGAKGQAELALTHLKNILRASGSSLNNVVKTTVYLQDFNDFSTVNEVYRDGMFPILTSYITKNKTKSFPFFSQILVFVRNFPARTCIQVAKLPLGALVEIEAIALLQEVINNFHPTESKL